MGEIPIAKTYQRALAARFRNTIYGYLRSVLDVVVPVQQIGHRDFSDTERAQWSIYSYAPWANLQFTSCSISSRLDLAIEAIEVAHFNTINNPTPCSWIVYTPVSSYVPWGGTAPVVYWVPGIRPRIEFDLGNTFVISGSQGPASSPVAGWWGMSELSVGNNAHMNPLYFDPPLILPATMFLTVQSGVTNTNMIVSWRYREIG